MSVKRRREKLRGVSLGFLSDGPGMTLMLMVCGIMTYHGIGLLTFVERNMSSRKYIDTLDTYLWPV